MVTTGVNLWLSTLANPCPGMCFMTVPMEFSWKKSIQISPILEIFFLFFEKDLSPIILLAPLTRRSKTGTVFILTPIDLSKYEVLSINNL